MRRFGQARFALLLAAAYLIVAAFGMSRHEMWRDELEVLATIRSHTLGSMLAEAVDTNLYYFLLFGWVKLCSGSAAAFQAFHLLVATAVVYVFARHAPFGRLAQVLHAFGYFALFEYGMIARDYSFASLLILVTVALLARGCSHPVGIAAMLLVLANHGLFSAFAAAGLGVHAVLDRIQRGVDPAERRRLAAAAAILLAGAALLVVQYGALARSRSAQVQSVEQATPGTTLRAVWNAWVPLPDLGTAQFWNTNVVPYHPVPIPEAPVSLGAAHVFGVTASLLLLGGAIVLLSQRISVLAAFVVSAGLDLAFLHYLSVLYMRYVGFLFLALVACAWLAAASTSSRAGRPWRGAPWLTALLVVHCVAGAFAWIQDVERPFTASEAAANFIREQGLEGRTTFGFVDYIAAPVAVRLDKPFYFAESRRFATYVDWHAEAGRQEVVPFEDVLAEGQRVLFERGEPLLYVLSFEIKSFSGGPLPALAVAPGVVLARLAAFEEGIVADEYYYLYELREQAEPAS